MKASMLVLSHLSDAQELINFKENSEAIEKINFAKYIIINLKGDLNQEINPDEMWNNFQNIK